MKVLSRFRPLGLLLGFEGANGIPGNGRLEKGRQNFLELPLNSFLITYLFIILLAMLRSLLLVSFIAFCVAIPNAGSIAPVYVVDAFDATQKDVLVYTRTDQPQTNSGSLKNATILGGQRDITVTFNSGPGDVFFTSGVTGGFYFVDGPTFYGSFTGEAILTFAGLNDAGLNIDFTQGNTTGIAMDAFASSTTNVLMTATDMRGGISTLTVVVVNTGVNQNFATYQADYDTFQGTCDFASLKSLSLTTPIAAFTSLKVGRLAWASPALCCLYNSSVYGEDGFCESGAFPCPTIPQGTLIGSSAVQRCADCTF